MVSRDNDDEVAKQVIQSGVDLIFAGGEKFLLPKGVKGRFGIGVRKDGINLIQKAQEMGYTVIYDLKNFKKHLKVEKILGIFAHDHTFNSVTEEEIQRQNLNYYERKAPTIAQMTKSALQFLEHKNKQFFMVVEEEGTDNFSNLSNTKGFLSAGKRADNSLGVAQKFLTQNPDTLLITTSDSNAGGLLISESKYTGEPELYTSGSFLGRYSFSIIWGSPQSKDSHGGILVKADGLNSHRIQGLMENTDIYRVMYQTLFGKKI